MKKNLLVACLLLCCPVYAQWSGNTSPAYPELIAYYQKLDRLHPEIELYAMGKSDTDWPIYVCIINGAQDSLKTFQKAREKTTILINNAIHPGEPDGVNACLIWIDEWIKNGKKTRDLPVIAIIPAYNVGGMFNRSSTSRANQEGPEEYGFRGNSQNLDLNRDFIKMDSPNAFTFAKIYQSLDPDVFVDTHVSNGADYQYTLTYISSMKERMSPDMRNLTYGKCIPFMTEQLKKQRIDLFPYIELQDDIPEKGIIGFNDLPRYSMGYASLFHAVSFTLETHMLKPFPERVEATGKFLDILFRWTNLNASEIEASRRKSIDWSRKQQQFSYNFKLIPKADSVLFKGFQAVYKQSEVTGLQRLSYDRKQPYTKNVPYFGTYQSSDMALIPRYYVVSGSAGEVIRRLEANHVEFRRIQRDSMMFLTTTRIHSYETSRRPYEGHYRHSQTSMKQENDSVLILKGSILIPADQPRRSFLVSVLESQAEDSYFSWNFFDSHLQQKEYFSSYVFEDMAVKILATDPVLKKDFEERKRTDEKFAQSPEDQLFFIYQRSAYYEKRTANKLPVFGIY